MPVDPAQDPFGAAMLAAAALFGLSVLIVLAQRVRGASTAAGGWVMGLALVAFLGAAVAGAAERVQAGPSEATPTPIAAEPDAAGADADSADADGPETAGASETDTVGDTDAAGANAGDTDADGDAPDTDGEAVDSTAGTDPEPPPDPDVHPDVARLNAAAAEGSFIAVTDLYRQMKKAGKMPKEVKAHYEELREARTREIREWMRTSNQVQDGTCRDPAKIRAAFDDLAKIDRREPLFKLASVVVEKLERCRRRYATWLEAEKHRERAALRADFGRKLAEEWTEPGRKVASSTSGKNGTQLRLVGSVLTDERIQAEIDAGILDRMTEQGFARVTFSDGRKASQKHLKPAPEKDLANEDLEAQGLGSPLKL